MPPIIKKTISCGLTISLMFPSISLANVMGKSVSTTAGDISVDGTTKTGVDRAQNGVPVINIAPPSGAGVSHNRFQDFNVGSEGAIMNNSNQMAISQLGGALYANPNLDLNKEASRVILNEVTSTRASRLLGATEIHGRSAEYILANPNGITCNGCGFINTPRITLGTGRPEMQNGDFMGLHIDPAGQVNIEGNGLNAGNVDYFDIVTRMLNMSGEIHANDLNIKTGNDYYDAKTGVITSQNTTDPASPALSIDSSLLGGIYADRITFESTEFGPGVNTKGSIESQQDLNVTADGRIEYANSVSQTGSVNIRSKNSDIIQSEYVAAKQNVNLTAGGKINLSGGSPDLNGNGVYSGGDVNINANSGIENDAQITSLGQASFMTDRNFNNNGSVSAGTNIEIKAGSFESDESGRLISYGDTNLAINQEVNLKGGEILSQGNLNLGSQGNITNSGLLTSHGDLNISAGGQMLNKSEIQAADIKLTADSLTNSKDGQILSYGNADVTVNQDTNLDGQVVASANLNINGLGKITNQGDIQGGQQVSLRAGQDFDNEGSILAGTQGNDSALLKITGNSIKNGESGNLLSYGDADLQSSEDINLSGAVAGHKNVSISGKGDLNNQSNLQAGRDASFTIGKVLKNQGTILAGAEDQTGGSGISVNSDSLENDASGKLLSYGGVSASVKNDINLDGQVVAYKDVNLSGSNLTNRAQVQAGREINATFGNTIRNEGTLLTGNESTTDPLTGIDLAANVVNNAESGQILSYGGLNVTGNQAVNLAGGDLIALGDMSIGSPGDIFNGANLHADGKLNISADSVHTSANGSLTSNGDLMLLSKQDLLLLGRLTSYGDMEIFSQGSIDNYTDLYSDKLLSLLAGQTISNYGSLSGGKNSNMGILINSNSMNNAGKISSYGSTALTIGQDYDITGQIMTYGDLTLSGGKNITNKTDLNVGGRTSIFAGQDFSNGYLSGDKSILSHILSNGDINVNAQNITNYGSIETGGNLNLEAQNAFTNDRRVSDQGTSGNALLVSAGNANIFADRITNSAGEIYSMKNMTLQKNAQGEKNSSVDNVSSLVGPDYISAVIEADGDVSIRSLLLNNRSYDYGYYWVDRDRVGDPGVEKLQLVYEDHAHSGLKAQPSFITAGQDLNVEGGDILNHASSLSTGRNMILNGRKVNNEDYAVPVNDMVQIYMNRHYIGDGVDIMYEDDKYFTVNVVADFRPVLFAANNLTINSNGEVSNGTPAASHQKAISSANLTEVKQTGVIPTFGIDVPKTEINGQIQTSNVDIIPINAAALPLTNINETSLLNVSALFQLSKNPDSQYLIESRSEYTSIPGLKGSKYFLDRIGYNPQTDVKLIGDDEYLAKLIERSILTATGRRYLEQGIGASSDQMAELYDNAYEESEELKLSVGIALSAEQIDQLQKDIVWLVEAEILVDGKPQKILVPQVYLSRATRDSLENPDARIEANAVAIKANGDVNNYGKLSGGDSLCIDSAKNINNLQSNIVSKGDLALLAGGNILNQGGEISADKDLLLKAQGNLTSSNIVERQGESDLWKDKIVALGDIHAGGSAALSAGKDVNILGTTLSAGKDLSLDAGENVNILADSLESHSHALKTIDGGGSHEETHDNTRHQSASVQSGGSMQINSGKDVAIVGGNLASNGDMTIAAKENLTVASVEDTDSSYIRDAQSGRTSSEETLNAHSGVRQRASNLTAGNDFLSQSGGDTNIIASNISAGGNGTMLAGNSGSEGSLNIFSATDSDEDYSYHKESHMAPLAMALGGVTGMLTGGAAGAVTGVMVGANARRGEMSEDEHFHTKEEASNLKFGGNLTMASAGDTNIVSGKIKADGNAAILAGAGLYVGAKSEINNDRHTVQDIKPDYAGVAAGAAVTGFVAGAASALTGALMPVAAPAALGAVATIGAGTIAGGFLTEPTKGIVNKEDTKTTDLSETHLASSQISAGGDLNLDAPKEIIVTASKLKSGGSLSMDSQGDVTVQSGQEIYDKKETETKTGFEGFDVKFNRSSADFNWKQKGEETEKETARTTQSNSELTAGGDILIHSGNDTNLISSDLAAGERVKIAAGKDIHMLIAKESETDTERNTSIENKFTQTVGNSWMETGLAAVDAGNSVAQETKGTQGEGGKYTEVNAAIAAGKATVEVYQIAKLAKSLANSAASVATFGFYTNSSVTEERDAKSSSSEKSTEVGTSIESKNIDLQSGQNVEGRGVNLLADGGDLHIKAGGNIKIESSETSAGEKNGEDKSTIKSNVFSTDGDFIPSVSLAHSEGSNTQVTQNNSQIKAKDGKVILKSGADTDLLGVNVKAANVDMTGIGGNLTLASKQDRKESNSSDYSLTLGDKNVGFSIGAAKSNETWTNSQSNIIGTESVDIKAKDLNLIGSVIANQQKDGWDGGNLTVSVNRLDHEDLKDTSEASSYSFGMGVDLSKKGDTNLSASNGGHDKEGVTLATIGQGDIAVGGNLTLDVPINRDLIRSQQITKDETTGGLDVNLSVSNELITGLAKNGAVATAKNELKEIKDTVSELPQNLEKVGKRAAQAADDLGESLKMGLDHKVDGFSGVIDEYKLRTAKNEAYAQMTPEERDMMKHPENYSLAEKIKTLNKFNEVACGILGIDPAQANFFSADLVDENTAIAKNGSGADIDKRLLIAGTDANQDKNDIYYEADKTNQENVLAEAAGHELARYRNIQEGVVNATSPDGVSGPQDALARNSGQQSVEALDFEIKLQGDKSTSAEPHIPTALDQELLARGNSKIDQSRETEAWLQIVANAGIGAATDYASQVFNNHFGDKKLTWADSASLENIDLKSIAISAGTSALGYGLGSSIKKLGDAWKLSAPARVALTESLDFASNVAVNSVDQYARKGQVDMKSAIEDAVKNKVVEKAMAVSKMGIPSLIEQFLEEEKSTELASQIMKGDTMKARGGE